MHELLLIFLTPPWKSESDVRNRAACVQRLLVHPCTLLVFSPNYKPVSHNHNVRTIFSVYVRMFALHQFHMSQHTSFLHIANRRCRSPFQSQRLNLLSRFSELHLQVRRVRRESILNGSFFPLHLLHLPHELQLLIFCLC